MCQVGLGAVKMLLNYLQYKKHICLVCLVGLDAEMLLDDLRNITHMFICRLTCVLYGEEEARWLICSSTDCNAAVLGLNPAPSSLWKTL
jgi:hypothetical protein